MSQNVKVLVTTGIYPPEIGGPATYTALLEKEMPNYGVEVSVLPFRAVRRFPAGIRHLIFLFRVLNFGRKVNLLYSQDPVSVGLPTAIAAKILGKPFLVRIAGDWVWEQSVQRFGVKDSIDDFQNKKYGWKIQFLRTLQSFTARCAERVITPSQYFRKLVSAWNPEKNNVITIYNGIDFKDIGENDGNFEPKTITSAGRLVPWKGFDFLIRFMNKLPDWKLYIAGDGPDKEKLERLIKDLKLDERVVLLGRMERIDLIKKIQKSEIFILNTSFESFSFQVVETMRAGTPVITTDIGNLAEIIEDGKEGFLVKVDDEKGFLEAINKLQDLGTRERIVNAALKKSEIFSLENTLKQTAAVVKDLAKNESHSS